MHNLLRLLSWPRTLGVCLLAAFIGKFILRNIVHDPYSTLHIGIALGILTSRALLGWYAAWDRRRQAAATATGRREAALSILWRRTVAMVRFSIALSMGCVCWLMRKRSRMPPMSPMSGTAIHYMKNSQYATVLAILLVSVFADIPITAMLVSAFEHDPARRHAIHTVIMILTALTLICILGDRWHLQDGCHLIDEGFLRLRIGKRVAADLPVGRIAAIERMRGSAADWRKQTGHSIKDVIQISPANIADKPNVCLTIGEGTPIFMRINMFESVLPRYVLLYVDEPQALINAIQAHGAVAPA